MGRRGSGGALALVGTLLLVPGADARLVEGSLIVETGPIFPAGATVELPSAIAFLGETREAGALELVASRLTVHVHEKRYLDAAGVVSVQQGEHMQRSWESTNVAVRSVEGSPAGFAAFLAANGSTIAFTSAQPVAAEHRSSTLFSSDGNVRVTRDPTDPRQAFFQREIVGDHVYVEGQGTLGGVASGTLRVQGWTLALEGDENATTLRTGDWSPRLGEGVVRWAFLTFENATLRITSPNAPFQIAGPEASQVAWNGMARVRVVDGALRTEAADYASVGLADLAGDLRASLFPVADGDTNLRLAAIRGDLASTTLAEHPRLASLSPAAPAPLGGWPAATLAVVAAVLAGGAAGGIVAKRPWRAKRERAPPEDRLAWCLEWASFFEEHDDAASALECLACARQHVDEPDHELLLWEGSCLDRLGNLEEALAAFEAAVAVAPRGECEAAFSAALVAGQMAREEPALLNLRLALMGDPFLVEVVDALAESDDDPFAALRARPSFRGLVREARGWARAAGTR